MVSQDWMEKDFYAILGVPKDVDAKTLKKTYRKLAREWHPDAKPGDRAAEQRFKDIGEAYAVLSDPEKRKQYDAFGAAGPGAFHGGAGNVRFEEFDLGNLGEGGQRALQQGLPADFDGRLVDPVHAHSGPA